MSTIKPWVWSRTGPRPHDTPRKLNSAGRKGGWTIKFVAHLAQSLRLNTSDMGFFASLKRRLVWGIPTIDEVDEGISAILDEYDKRDA